MAQTDMQAIEAFIQKNEQNILRDIGRLVACPSVAGQPEPGAPFGREVAAALEEALQIARKLGLDTGSAEGYMGWAEVPGQQPEKYLATITHLDVVPAGEGWNGSPWKMELKEGWLIGRGVTDDKGPAVLCLYALKYLKEKGTPLRYPVRALLGVDEESDMGDVEYYNAHYPAPAFCFSPDGEFPVCNGEKGVYAAQLVSPVLEGTILSFTGGTAGNAVADRAEALVKAPLSAFCPMEHITLQARGKGCTLVQGWGVGGHASMPEDTRSAIGLVVDCLLQSGVCAPAEQAYLKILHKLHSRWDGSALGIDCCDGLFDPLTVVGGVISMEKGVITQTVDSRYPTATNARTLTERLQKACGTAAKVKVLRDEPPFYMEADSPAVEALLKAYNDVKGQQARPFTMGGGTYARKFPKAVSFGPEYHGRPLPAFGGPIHSPNECAHWAETLEALKIYILALEQLQQAEL